MPQNPLTGFVIGLSVDGNAGCILRFVRRRFVLPDERKVPRSDLTARLGQYHHMLNQVLQLADVTGPRVPAQGRNGAVRQFGQRPTVVTVIGPVATQEMVCQERDIFLAVPQRR